MVISSPVRIHISVRCEEQVTYQYQEPESDLEEPVSVGEWLVSMLLMLIPCVNIVCQMFVWAFSSREKRSKSNYLRLHWIFAAIILVHLHHFHCYLWRGHQFQRLRTRISSFDF